MSEEPVEYLVSRRSRRSTAGNRMAAALAEMALEDTNKDLDDDNEFVVEKFEEDAFESDFESTDEEAASQNVDTGEKEVQEEEKRARKTARSRLERATAAAHEKHKASFNPLSTAAKSKPKPKPAKRRVSLGTVINAETGEVLGTEDEARAEASERKRKSKRRHTILNTSATATRMKQSEEKKASLPKKARPVTRSYTQVELIALALDNEEGNLVEHRDYLKLEEEKRARARVVRKAIDGPLVRWVSRVEEVTEVLQPPPPVLKPPTSNAPIYSNTFGTSFRYDSRQSVSTMYKSLIAEPSSLNGQSATFVPFIPIVTPTPVISVTTNVDNPSSINTNISGSLPASVVATTSKVQEASPVLPAANTAAVTGPPPFQVWPPPAASTVVPSEGPPQYKTPTPAAASIPNVDHQPPSPATAQTPTSVAVPSNPDPEPITQGQDSSCPIPIDPALEIQVQHSTPTEPSAASLSPTHVHMLMNETPKAPTPSTSAAQLPEPQTITYKTTRNYLVHELAQTSSTPKPQWRDTMAAFFGDHVKWEELKVYVGRGRPLSRPVQICPITGLPAPYIDPRTGVPYANQRAYDVLTRILRHEFAWSPDLGCYIGEVENPAQWNREEQPNEPNYMEVDG